MTLKEYIALGAFLLAAIISLIALYLPPQGVIDYSVLMLTAQLLVLTSTIIGINMPTLFNNRKGGEK